MLVFNKNKNFGILMLLPALIVLAAIVIGPLVYTLYLAFCDWSISSVSKPVWVGIKNFLAMFNDEYFYKSLKVTFHFTFGSLLLEIIFGIGLAQLLCQPFVGRNIVRAIMIIPFASTPVAMSLVWKLMLNPTLGIINYFLDTLGIGGAPWLAQYTTVIPTLILIDVWFWTPFIALIVLAGMMSIDKELYQAGEIDGASNWQLFRFITLPLVTPAIIIAAVLRFIDSIKTFDTIYVLTEGGPGFASRILNLFIYDQAFRYFKMGYASSLVIVTILIILGISFLLLRFRRIHL